MNFGSAWPWAVLDDCWPVDCFAVPLKEAVAELRRIGTSSPGAADHEGPPLAGSVTVRSLRRPVQGALHFGSAWQPVDRRVVLEPTRAEREALRQRLAASESSEELATTRAERDALRQRLAASASSEGLETTRVEHDALRQCLAAMQ